MKNLPEPRQFGIQVIHDFRNAFRVFGKEDGAAAKKRLNVVGVRRKQGDDF